MTREEKHNVIQDLTAQLSESSTIYLADISGLNALNTTELRRACFKANLKLAVVKNTLLAKAMEASDKDFGELIYNSGLLHGGVLLLRLEDAKSGEKVKIVENILMK